MAATLEEIEKAKELRLDKGWTHEAIARELGKTSKTIQRWEQAGWTANRVNSRNRNRRNAISEDWPKDRCWPNWTPDELKRFAGWNRGQAAQNVAIVRMAEGQNNLYLPWFYRRMIETAKEYGEITQIDRTEYAGWMFAIAGLPVLAEWLECPECTGLAELIKQHRLWETSKDVSERTRRSRYARDAKPLVGPIKQRLLLFATFASMDNDRPKKDIPLPVLFSGLSQRIPMFDKSPMLSLFRRSSVGDIFNLIFQAQRPTVPQIDS